MMTWEWLLIAILSWLGQNVITMRPKIENRLGAIGAAVIFYLLVKFLPYKACQAFELSVEMSHVIAGILSFCCVASLFIWLRNGTIKQDADNQKWLESYKKEFQNKD